MEAYLTAALAIAALVIATLVRMLQSAATNTKLARREAEQLKTERDGALAERDAAETAHRTATRDADGVLERANAATDRQP